ncbi:hypothetical protein [Staphylococcus pasteuri]|uniref:hypothetical protein n=1 Tax=Staphylococcus pasteuri TaxID=45972 RepID=UPI001C3F9F4F|nr:hypothetical protein [Staphylococcus pasteuri]
MNRLQRMIRSIDKWIAPYKYRLEDENQITTVSQKHRKKERFKGKQKKHLTQEEEQHKKDMLQRGALGIKVISINEQMDDINALNRLLKSQSHTAYYSHNQQHHQLAVKFEKGSAWRYHERNPKKIKQLIPVVKYRYKGESDRTHVIPIGYHGSENDERLLIDFSRKINRGGLKKAEDYIARINETEAILWFVDIVRQNDDSVKWRLIVWDNQQNIVIERQFHDHSKFTWS